MLHLQLTIPLCAYKAAVWGIVVFTSVVGVWFLLAPQNVLNLQIAAYRAFRWKIEPVDWNRELRVTRLAGAIAVFCGVLTSLVLAFQTCPLIK